MYYNNKKLALSIFWVILGIALIVLATKDVIDGIWLGMGGGFTLVGILQIIKNIKYRKDDDYKRNVDISVNDERNKSIRQSAWAYAGYIFILVACITCLVLQMLNYRDYASILGYCVCFILFVYWIAYTVLQKTK